MKLHLYFSLFWEILKREWNDGMKWKKRVLKGGVFLLLIGLLFYFGLYWYAKYMTNLVIKNANEFYIYDGNGNLVEDLSDKWVPLEEISPYVLDATIAIEDKNFYQHHGFDYLRILKSLYINFIHGKTLQGASTISQQLSKNLFLSFEKTWSRKMKEAWLTIQLETQYDKDEILEAYLNTINYGGIYGIENASHYYFHKSAKDLSLAQASMLVGIPKSPSHYSPLVDEEAAKERQAIVLKSMVREKMITEEEQEAAYAEVLTYYGTLSEQELKMLMYYQDAVMKELETIDDIPETFLETGGLKIYTYLDLQAQTILENAIDQNISNPDLQVSAIMMDPNNGHIIALTGGRNYSVSQYNRAISSKRQVGSTMKPILYYAALENGFTESTTFTSEKTTFVFSENKTYTPSNYNNKYGNKNITMATAISYSDNIYAVKTHLFLGEQTLVDMAKRLGITASLEPIPSLALGSEEISLYEMVQAYASFANLGYKVEGKLIAKVEDMEGNILYENKEKKEPILNSSLVYILNEALTSTYNYHFIDYGYPTCYDLTATLTHKYAIKTGSTDQDRLVLGFNPNIVLGLWSGYDIAGDDSKNNSAELRAVWRDTMEKYLEGTEDVWYSMPDNVVGTLVNPITGEIASPSDKNATMFYYLKGTEPTYQEDQLDSLIPTIKDE